MISRHSIKQKIANFTKQPIDNIEDEKPISALVADSFMLVELMLTLQEEYSISLSQAEMENIITIHNLIRFIQQKTEDKISISIA